MHHTQVLLTYLVTKFLVYYPTGFMHTELVNSGYMGKFNYTFSCHYIAKKI